MPVREYNPKQEIMFWLPPQDVLSTDHPCFVVDEIVEQLDLSSLPNKEDAVGAPAYDYRLNIIEETRGSVIDF